METDLKSYGDSLVAALPGAAESAEAAFGEVTLNVVKERWLDVLTHLRDAPDCLFHCVVDVTAVDWPGRPERFDVVCHLLSPRHNRRIRVKTKIKEDDVIASAISVYPGVEWYERETYDLFGIIFANHPDLRRLLTDYGFDGHPLRKDFPTSGYVEVRYDDQQKRVVYQPVDLPLAFRQFDFLSPWEGPDYPLPVLPGDEKASAGGKP